MNKTHTVILALVLTLSIGDAPGHENDANAEPSMREAIVTTAAATPWRAAPGLPAGAHVAILDGDPSREGPFTMRLKMPAGYTIPPHTHTTAERITVISGTVRLGTGEKFDESAVRELNAGDFAIVPEGAPHFAVSVSEAVLQIHSEGPFQRKYVEAVDAGSDAKK